LNSFGLPDHSPLRFWDQACPYSVPRIDPWLYQSIYALIMCTSHTHTAPTVSHGCPPCTCHGDFVSRRSCSARVCFFSRCQDGSLRSQDREQAPTALAECLLISRQCDHSRRRRSVAACRCQPLAGPYGVRKAGPAEQDVARAGSVFLQAAKGQIACFTISDSQAARRTSSRLFRRRLPPDSVAGSSSAHMRYSSDPWMGRSLVGQRRRY